MPRRFFLAVVFVAVTAPLSAQPAKPEVEALPKAPAWVAGYKFRWTLRLAAHPTVEAGK